MSLTTLIVISIICIFGLAYLEASEKWNNRK